VRGIIAGGRAGTALLHVEQIALDNPRLEKSRPGLIALEFRLQPVPSVAGEQAEA
jgi:hypothetical protein